MTVSPGHNREFSRNYYNALFGLLSPFICSLFFLKGKNSITALTLTYSMLPLGLIMRRRSLFFGWIGDCFSRREALFFSLTGMAAITFMMGRTPIYQDIGPWAPLFLALGRMFQFFCCWRGVWREPFSFWNIRRLQKRSLVSSYYDAFSVGGALLASGLIALMSAQGLIEEGWRYFSGQVERQRSLVSFFDRRFQKCPSL